MIDVVYYTGDAASNPVGSNEFFLMFDLHINNKWQTNGVISPKIEVKHCYI